MSTFYRQLFFVQLIFIVCVSLPFAQPKAKAPVPQFNVNASDFAFRIAGTNYASWTEYKKTKRHKEYFQFLDSVAARFTVRVPLKDYSYDERKKLSTIRTEPAEFLFEAEEEIKLRLIVEQFTIKSDSLLMNLVVKKDVLTYLNVSGIFVSAAISEVQATPREKRKVVRLTLNEVKVEQSQNTTEDFYVWKTQSRLFNRIGDIIEQKRWSDGFDLAGMGFRSVTER
ncbi:MAG: hypothetical protein FJ218_00160 [Ignavibacteria bacterium]|nr:hypothetical protein [Ignavibacteria bacterium]